MQAGPAWEPTGPFARRPQPEIRPFQPPTGIVRYGPGVNAAHLALDAADLALDPAELTAATGLTTRRE